MHASLRSLMVVMGVSLVACASEQASPRATPRPAQVSSSMSLRPSPIASTSEARYPRPATTSAIAVALFTP